MKGSVSRGILGRIIEDTEEHIGWLETRALYGRVALCNDLQRAMSSPS